MNICTISSCVLYCIVRLFKKQLFEYTFHCMSGIAVYKIYNIVASSGKGLLEMLIYCDCVPTHVLWSTLYPPNYIYKIVHLKLFTWSTFCVSALSQCIQYAACVRMQRKRTIVTSIHFSLLTSLRCTDGDRNRSKLSYELLQISKRGVKPRAPTRHRKLWRHIVILTLCKVMQVRKRLHTNPCGASNRFSSWSTHGDQQNVFSNKTGYY